jgi:hypothetical protein
LGLATWSYTSFSPNPNIGTSEALPRRQHYIYDQEKLRARIFAPNYCSFTRDQPAINSSERPTNEHKSGPVNKQGRYCVGLACGRCIPSTYFALASLSLASPQLFFLFNQTLPINYYFLSAPCNL